MNVFKSIALSVLMLGSVLSTNTVSAAEPYPLEYFALRDVVKNVNLSPNGKKIALLKIPSKDGEAILEVYNSDKLDQEPFRVNADPMEIQSYFWLSDSTILLNLRQKVSDKITGFNQGVFRGKIAKLDLKTKQIKEFKDLNSRIVGILPNEANKVLMSITPGKLSGRGASAIEATSYYKLDVNTGRKSLVLKGSGEVGNVRFDREGNPRYAFSRDTVRDELVYLIRKPGSKRWEEIYRLHEDNFESFRINGFDPENENILFVTAHNGRDTTGLWEFDLTTKKFGELIYARKDANVFGVRRHSNVWKSSNIVAVGYETDKTHYEYFDEIEGATYEQLKKIIPHSHDLIITSRTREGNDLTVYNVGPRDPGTYYLLKDGKIQTIGSKQPLLESDKLADVKFINWKARDGKTIRGYLTVPNGKGPFPLVVMPHGGPFVSKVTGYDEWGQMLANNGYMVLEPEYRGSTNWGLDFYKSAFINGGKGGYAMQDDKDDGALHLVKQGLVDKDRIAMFGWSYGGYAALIAASRENQIHQCVIAGAAVADNLQQLNYYRDRGIRGTQKTEQVKFWAESISPIKEVAKVNVPMLLIHGTVDQRVPVSHAKKYIKELEDNNISYKYIELDGADHFSNTLDYNHQYKLYSSMIDFLKNDCGPGGL